jgi:hypothetical protein
VLLAPPVFFFAALALLLLASGLHSVREWFWCAASAGLAAAWALGGTTTLASGVTSAIGVMSAGLFLALGLATGWTVFRRALTALIVSGTVVACWSTLLGHGWSGVQSSFGNTLSAMFTAQADTFAARGGSATLIAQLRVMAESSMRLAPYFAGFLVLGGMAGLMLAARWQEQLSGRPVGRRLALFTRFRFSDQVIWLLVAGVAAVLLVPSRIGLLGTPLRVWAANLALVVAVCYGLRGLAVYRAAAARTTRVVSVILALVALCFWPVAATGLMRLGRADSWIDFRRRLLTPQPEDGPDDRSDSAR